MQMAALVCLASNACTASAATISGIVKDSSGVPIQDVRIDHTGKPVVVTLVNLHVKPGPDEVRTDAEGRFRVGTNVPAVVVRKAGYESQRIRITGDAEWSITLERVQSTSTCKLPVQPKFKTKTDNDVDYTATWFYIKDRDGSHGIISGSGAAHSWGAPSDDHVWRSVEYADGKYWRSRSIFGAAARFSNETREVADRLDCEQRARSARNR